MRGFLPRHSFLVGVAVLSLGALQVGAQQSAIHWVDFHSDADQPVIVWVERALADEKWTAIREIGVLYDAALVVTVERENADALPGNETFQIWSVNLTNHVKTPLVKGVNLRWVDWVQVLPAGAREPAILYDDCRDCASTTYFTTFHYDREQHILRPRWMRGGEAVPVWTNATPKGVSVTQVYALLGEPDGHQYMSTWSHFDYGQVKDPEDFVYRFDVDPPTGLERMGRLGSKESAPFRMKLCQAQGIKLAWGQSSEMCQELVGTKPVRKPVTTPPAHNQGRSVPPGTKPK
jgi:hypothetical protein